MSERATSPDRDPFTLGPWTVIPRELRLQRTDAAEDGPQPEDGRVQLQQKEMHLLLALVDQDGRPLSSEALRKAVWGDQAITDGVAKNLVWQLRKSLGESAEEPGLLETVPGAGYRLRESPRPIPQEPIHQEPIPQEEAEGWHPLRDAATDEADGQASSPRRLPEIPPAAWITLGVAALAILALTWTRSDDGPSPGANPSESADGSTLESLFAPAILPRLVVDLPGRESDLAVDPEGRHLLFSHRGDSPADDLYVFDLDDQAETPLQLTRTDTADAGSAWSRDGRRIAFTRSEPHTHRYEIHVMPATGGESRLVGRVVSARPVHLEWLDGQSLAVARIPVPNRTDTGTDIEAGSRAQGLERLDIATGELTHLTRNDDGETFDRGPALSPDGRRLVFVRWQGSAAARIGLLDVASGDTRLIGPPMAGISGPAWLAGTERILFAGTESSLWRLWWLPADGSEPPEPFPATAGAMDVGEVATSSSGVVVYEQSLFDLDLLRLDVRGSGAGLEAVGDARRLARSDRAEMAPAPHPDGRAFAFLSDRTGPVALWMSEGRLSDGGLSDEEVSDGGGPPRKLNVDGVTFRSHPTWSPDGSVLALSVRRGEQSDIAIVRAEDGHVDFATDTPRRELLPSWRPDGLAIRFASPSLQGDGTFDLWEKELWRGDPARLLVRDVLRSQALSDGRLVGYRNHGQLVLVDPARPDDARDLPLDLLPGDLGNWHASDDGILWLGVRSKTLRFFDFATETITDLFEVDHPAATDALRVSADGGSLYLSVMVRDDARLVALRP